MKINTHVVGCFITLTKKYMLNTNSVFCYCYYNYKKIHLGSYGNNNRAIKMSLKTLFKIQIFPTFIRLLLILKTKFKLLLYIIFLNIPRKLWGWHWTKRQEFPAGAVGRKGHKHTRNFHSLLKHLLKLISFIFRWNVLDRTSPKALKWYKLLKAIILFRIWDISICPLRSRVFQRQFGNQDWHNQLEYSYRIIISFQQECQILYFI